MARLTLTLLGGFRARLDPGAPLALPTRKAQALLAYLVLPPGQAHPRGGRDALEQHRAGLDPIFQQRVE